MKTPVAIRIPDGAKISNYLYDDLTVDELNQDIVTVILANAHSIEVGWFPENDPTGKFWIRVFWGDEEIRLIKADAAYEVVEYVERLSIRFNQPHTSVSNAATYQTIVKV